MSGKVFLIAGIVVFLLSIALGIAGFLYFFFSGFVNADETNALRSIHSGIILALVSNIAGIFGMVAGLILIIIGGIKLSDNSKK